MIRIGSIILLLLLLFTPVRAHEQDGYVHGSYPPSYGSVIVNSSTRMLYIDKDNVMCVYIVFKHDRLHVSKPFKCK